MRTNIIKSIFLAGLLILVSCESELRMPDVSKTTLPKITLDPTSDVLIQGGILRGKFIVDTYYSDKPVDSRIVVAMKGNYSNIKTFIPSLTTFPSTQTVTDAQLVSLFGLSSINAGDYFEIGLDVKMEDGKWYPAFNPLGVAYGSGPMNLPGSAPILKFKAVCAFNINEYVGNASIVDPYFYEGTYAAAVEKVNDTQLKIKKFAEFSGDLILTINSATHTVVVNKQVFAADLGVWGATWAAYKNPSAVGTGEIDACNKKIILSLTYASDQAGFGKGPVTIKF
jgi:hypothetical protein